MGRMISEKLIKDRISESIRDGANQYAIYPFGANGANVKRILNDYFDISPDYIIDNCYCKYNAKIISFDEFDKSYKGKIILCIEDDYIHKTMLAEIEEFFPKHQILDLKEKNCNNDDFNREAIKNNICLSNIIPIHIEGKTISKKLKVRVLHNTSIAWNAIRSMCVAFGSDQSIDFKVIGDSKVDPILKKQTEGFVFCDIEDYKADEDKPDIFIMHHLFHQLHVISNLRENCNMIVVVLSSIQKDKDSLEKFFKQQSDMFKSYSPDIYIYESFLYKEIELANKLDKNMFLMHNPKFDGIYNQLKEKEEKREFEKLKGKKIVFWATDHGISYDSIWGCTLDLYAKTIFDYARCNPDIGFIFRPHPTLLTELRKYRYWSGEDLNLLIAYCDKTNNIVWDRNETYDRAFSVADAVLTDAVCGISCSALSINKPICLAFRSKSQIIRQKELFEAYDLAYSSQEIINFFNNIKAGNDNKKVLRETMFRKYIGNLDGKNGERIKEFIIEKYKFL